MNIGELHLKVKLGRRLIPVKSSSKSKRTADKQTHAANKKGRHEASLSRNDAADERLAAIAQNAQQIDEQVHEIHV